ncbi:hypothetical protein CERSUDRAFT_120191 [Gelatoporia subvermispora B]|uniref:Uncharacterized protein n=1 Tax=Ceriporiopsis subvermispora (strain B) TaxID=914234 RepID=M2QYJ1_CERS8|nr:hypothetical protein CERSUDRAFT_120191 [Gelatoporia subvermispora B]
MGTPSVMESVAACKAGRAHLTSSRRASNGGRSASAPLYHLERKQPILPWGCTAVCSGAYSSGPRHAEKQDEDWRDGSCQMLGVDPGVWA